MRSRDPANLLIMGGRPVGAASPADVAIAGGRIAAVGSVAGEAVEAFARRLDADGWLIAAGYIDLQVNGAAGHDLTADPGSVWQVGDALVRHGVTAFLPTIVTSPPGTLEAACRVVSEGPPAGYRGAKPLGVHAEGPFISDRRRGVHNPAHIRLPSSDETSTWSPAMGLRLVTLAPELAGACELAAALSKRGVVVSAGHSDATFDEARVGFDAGIRAATHLFNAMSGIDHRSPGLAAAALLDRRVTVWLIADGLHVDPAVVELAWRLAGPRVALVTDAIAALGMPDGRYVIGDVAVDVGASGARAHDGRLAGSILGLDAAVRNLVAFAGASPAEAVASVTSVPARLLALGERGRLVAGAVADIVVLDEELAVVATIVGGELVHASPAAAARWG
jgi:N-acetylglucosamine-6-phosphate deacetylase